MGVLKVHGIMLSDGCGSAGQLLGPGDLTELLRSTECLLHSHKMVCNQDNPGASLVRSYPTLISNLLAILSTLMVLQ